MLFDIVLNLCAQIYRIGVRGSEEFQLILNDLGMKGSKGAAVQEVF